MKTIPRLLLSLFLSLLCSVPTLAQTNQPPETRPTQSEMPTQSANVIVTATAHTQRVRYAALGEVNYIRLQVFAADGTLLFDSNYRLGNLVDWSLLNQQGQTLADGSYLFLVTVKDFAGNLTQKYGTALLEQNQISLQQTSREELSAAQATSLAANQLAQTLSPIDRIGALGVNSTQSTSTDVTTTNQTTTTNQKTAKQSTSGATNITTAGTIAKFADNSGTLTNSLITESGNQVVALGAMIVSTFDGFRGSEAHLVKRE